MNKKIIFFSVLFTALIAAVFIAQNPNIATDLSDNYTNGEVFTSQNKTFDFKTFTIKSDALNFTAKKISNGHTVMVDDTGNLTVNVIEQSHMINSQRDHVNEFLKGELEKTSWSVDGVTVHQIDFKFDEPLYSAYFKNSTADTIIYLSTPNEKETADMMNSLKFKEENHV